MPRAQDGLDAELELVDRVRVPAARMDGQEEPLAEHEVDLRGLQLVGAREHEHDDVDDVADELDLRPLVAVDDVLGDERMQPDVVADRLDDLGRGVGEVDPDAGVLVRQEVVELVGVVRLGDLALAPV